jgi:Protein of unknown function (DUF2384)
MQNSVITREKNHANTKPQVYIQSLAGAGLRGFFLIAQHWGLNEKDCMVLLGGPSRATYYNWKKGEAGKLSKDTIDRLSYIVGIHKALRILIPNEAIARAWIKNANDAPLFAGQAPLALMLSGNLVDLFRVRSYLDANRGGWG